MKQRLKKHFLALSLVTVALNATAEPIRVSIFTPEGELYFLGIFDVTFKPKLRYNKAYSCVAKQDFRPSIVCSRDQKGDKTQGRYCVKPSEQADLLCSKSLYVGG